MCVVFDHFIADMCNDKTKTTRKKGADTDSSLCHGCGKVPCVDDDFECPSCKHNFCNDCTLTCATECPMCYEKLCPNCINTKSVLIAVGGTVEFATMICGGRLVGSAKKKPVDIVLNITA